VINFLHFARLLWPLKVLDDSLNTSEKSSLSFSFAERHLAMVSAANVQLFPSINELCSCVIRSVSEAKILSSSRDGSSVASGDILQSPSKPWNPFDEVSPSCPQLSASASNLPVSNALSSIVSNDLSTLENLDDNPFLDMERSILEASVVAADAESRMTDYSERTVQPKSTSQPTAQLSQQSRFSVFTNFASSVKSYGQTPPVINEASKSQNNSSTDSFFSSLSRSQSTPAPSATQNNSTADSFFSSLSASALGSPPRQSANMNNSGGLLKGFSSEFATSRSQSSSTTLKLNKGGGAKGSNDPFASLNIFPQ
jgi:hypothetical protein